MKNLLVVICQFILCVGCISGQPQTTFSSRVIHAGSGDPVIGASVSVNGVTQGEKTSKTGSFTLELGAYFQPGKTVKILIYHPNYGSHLVEKIMVSQNSRGNQVPIEITPNNKLIIVGQVRDAKDKRFLPGIEVGISSKDLTSNVSLHTVKTNQLGQFKITIPKKILIKEPDYMDLLFHDPQNKYGDDKKTKSILSPVEIELTKGPGAVFRKTILIRSYKEVRITVQEGDLVSIESKGNIKVGTWVGTLGPEGKSGGIAGFPLEAYNIERNFNHGSLMYRISSTQPWKFCGGACSFVAQKNGVINLAFEVNDNNKTDNSGSFDVTVKVE